MDNETNYKFTTTYKIRNKILCYSGSKVEQSKIRKCFFIDLPTCLSVGDGSFINFFCHIYCGDYGHVTIGKNVFIGPDVKICCFTHKIGCYEKRSGDAVKDCDVVIDDGSWIGIGTTILPVVKIG